MDPAQYSSKEFAACFFAAANSLFLISESFFLISLFIIPSSFKISLQFRHPRGEWRSEMKFFLEARRLVVAFVIPRLWPSL